TPTVAAAAAGGTECIAHVANYAKDIEYAPGCTGHDEPELDPVSSLPGSAKDLTWTAVLPKDGRLPVSDVGPTFWWGGTVTDPNPVALFNQAFLDCSSTRTPSSRAARLTAASTWCRPPTSTRCAPRSG